MSGGPAEMRDSGERVVPDDPTPSERALHVEMRPVVTPSPSAPNRKQRQAEARAAKLEQFKKEQARRTRNRRIGIGSAIAGAVAVVALVATIIVTAPKAATYEAGGKSVSIEGVKTFDNTAGHVTGAVDYKQTPPAGGEHNPMWLNCGVYDRPVPNENAVHSLEHGAIWVTYSPDLSAGQLDLLKTKIPRTYAVLSPYDGLPAPIVLSGWNVQLQVQKADDPRIAKFFEAYWQSPSVPEPGASCTGAFDAPGKVS